MGGNSVTLGEHRGRKALVYVWASWCGCREQLETLQRFHEKHPGVAVISIACDVTGPEHPMRYLRRAKATFEMWIDATCLISRRWGLKRVGIPFLLDEEGSLLKAGEKLDESFLAEAEKLLAQPAARRNPAEPNVDVKNTQVEILMQSCTNFLSRKRVDDACGALRKALAIDPENRIIPKQVWAIRNPEKFYAGEIDKAWQAAQPPVTP
jgi:thiol-disulfide isomerase/thioredoxin